MLWLPFLIKALSTALIVVSASVLAEALGPFWGALIASLPVSAGPAYVFLAMQHGPDFIASSARGSFAANAVTGVFLIAYGFLARRLPAWGSLGAAVAIWLAGSFLTQQIVWTPVTVLLFNLIVYGIGLAVQTAGRAGQSVSARSARRWFDLPVRAVAVAGFVSLVVGGSSILGPNVTGMAAVFPISLSSVIVIVQQRMGSAATTELTAHALRSMLGFGAGLLVVHLAIRPWGVTAALLLGMLVSVGWSGFLLMLRVWRRAV